MGFTIEGVVRISRLIPQIYKGLRGNCGPLTKMLKKYGFQWSEEAKVAFYKLKEAVSQPLVLALPNFSLPFMIEFDASGMVVGVVLMQQEQLIAFYSQALKESSLTMSTYEKKLFDLELAVLKWRPYLLGRTFILKTNQHVLSTYWTKRCGHPCNKGGSPNFLAMILIRI